LEATEELLPVAIAAKREIAAGIFSFELRHPAGLDLPPFTAGAHISVCTPNGLRRKYSLCNSPGEHSRYVIAVKRESSGRGGSISLVDGAHAGGTLFVTPPKNNFALGPSRAGYIFIAGGIGITPVMSMIRHTMQQGERTGLYYLTRSQEVTAFRAELTSEDFKTIARIHHDGGDPAKAFDLWPMLEKPKGQQVYCCGPRTLMEAVRDMTGHWPGSAIHFESFTDGATPRPNDRDFAVRIFGSEKTIPVPKGTTILEALRREGYSLPSSCESGSCGTCRTALISGEADHRDFVLSEAERTGAIMICVSRALSDELVLDLGQTSQ
jgi:phthalate 4,5-dioxygenase reductase component